MERSEGGVVVRLPRGGAIETSRRGQPIYSDDLPRRSATVPVKLKTHPSGFVFLGKGGLLLLDEGGAPLHLHAAAALHLRDEGMIYILQRRRFTITCSNLTESELQVSVSAAPSSLSVTEAIFSPHPASLQPLPSATTEEEVVQLSRQTLPSHGQASALQVPQAPGFPSSEKTLTSVLSVSTPTQEEPGSCQEEPRHPIPRRRPQPPLSFPRKPRPRSEAFRQSSRAF